MWSLRFSRVSNILFVCVVIPYALKLRRMYTLPELFPKCQIQYIFKIGFSPILDLSLSQVAFAFALNVII